MRILLYEDWVSSSAVLFFATSIIFIVFIIIYKVISIMNRNFKKGESTDEEINI